MTEIQFQYLKARMDATQQILEVLETVLQDQMDEKKKKWILESKKEMLEKILALKPNKEQQNENL